jgi:hypothetical protein
VASEFDWAGFRALSKRLGKLLEGDRDDATLAEDLRRALTFLYTAGVTMPSAGDVYEEAGGEEFWNDVAAPSHTEPAGDATTIALAESLAERIASSVEAAQPDSLGDPEEVGDVAMRAAENLAEVHAGLSAGDALFDARREREAQWEWAFGFDEWGTHALVALSALHELLWGAR